MSMSQSDLALSNAIASNQSSKGTVIPNRIFVGGIAPETTDSQLKEFFSSFGAVKDTKIICDRSGASKGYGFVTFETQEDADKIINKESANLVFKERKLNIGPAVRKQVQPQIPAHNFSNMLIPAQLQSLYMQQPYTYTAATPLPNQVPSTPTIQYTNPATTQQWGFQPTPSTCVATPIYPDSAMYAVANNSNQAVQQQYLDVSEGTMHENSSNDVESRCNLVPTSAEALHTQLNSCQAITSLMSVQPGRPLPQSHLYNSTSPQPPPIKKMAPMASHFGDATMRCFSTPYVTGNMKPAVMPASICPSSRGPGLALLAGNPHDLRFKLEHERLATNIANIAPPTPPATPSAGSN
ncbi:protein boule-like isoform X3 [Watersipora subatra]|uniref:protein boule-like isoform X3 n=1 Tax=Watersipora subatra TaxID=2589382 RepID=UPI00355C2BC2